MISHISGQLLFREIDRVEIATPGGVGYELLIPLSVFEHLPKVGEQLSLHAHLVVKEDGWQLYGFASVFERNVFRKVLVAKGVGPSLALGMLSTLSAERLIRAIRDKDIATLQSVPRVGRKKAEQIILDLGDKMNDVGGGGDDGGILPEGAGAENAVRALVSLGYSMPDSEKAVRAALEEGGRGMAATDLIRRALAHATGGR